MRLHTAHHDRPGMGDLSQQIRDRLRERVPHEQRELQQVRAALASCEASWQRQRLDPALKMIARILLRVQIDREAAQ
jgi:hypothetical protein